MPGGIFTPPPISNERLKNRIGTTKVTLKTLYCVCAWNNDYSTRKQHVSELPVTLLYIVTSIELCVQLR